MDSALTRLLVPIVVVIVVKLVRAGSIGALRLPRRAHWLRAVLLLFAYRSWENDNVSYAAASVLLAVPPLWWPGLMLKLGAYRASVVVLALVAPLLWRASTRRRGSFFVAAAAMNHPDGWLARRAQGLQREPRGDSTGATLAGRAILAVHAGRLEDARHLFALVAGMSQALASRTERAFANHFCLADAASRGSWYETLERSRLGPLTPTAAVFALAARTRLEQLAFGQRLWGWLGWSLMPHRVSALRLLRWARAQAERGDAAPVTLDAALPARLQALARFAMAPPGSVRTGSIEHLAALTASLETNPDVLSYIRLRFAELGVQTQPGNVLHELQHDAYEALVAHLERAWISNKDISPDAAEAHSDAHQRMLDEIEQLCDIFCDRSAPERRAFGFDLWLLWAKLKDRVTLAWIAAPDEREVVMEMLSRPLMNLAADLWNDGLERAVAHDICLFLRDRLTHEPDSEMLELIQKNYKIMRNLPD